MPKSKKNVFIAEPSYILRKGLLFALNNLSFVDKVFEWNDSVALKDQITGYPVDIVVINPALLGFISGKSPKELLGLKKTTFLAAFVSSLMDKQYLQNFDAVIKMGDSFFEISESFRQMLKKNPEIVENEELSEREKDIVGTLVKGKSNKEIAEYLNISVHTVITHRRNISRKLGIHSPAGLTVYAIINKLVDVHDI